MSDRLDQLDYYTLLGVAEDASVREIKRAFRQFARRYHPDRFGDAPEDKRERAARIYRRGSEAFQVLTDEGERSLYDEFMKRGRLRLTADERARAAAAKAEPREVYRSRNEVPIKSPQARMLYQRAANLVRRGEWREAWKALKAAAALEPGNEFLRTRLEQLTTHVRQMPD